jgi:hypothetical protein
MDGWGEQKLSHKVSLTPPSQKKSFRVIWLDTEVVRVVIAENPAVACGMDHY